jgi:hypothetical protein
MKGVAMDEKSTVITGPAGGDAIIAVKGSGTNLVTGAFAGWIAFQQAFLSKFGWLRDPPFI